VLVLSRKKNQAINIGKNIIITVVDVQGDSVRIGIEAPRSIDIYRSEIYQDILSENMKAISTKQHIVEMLDQDLKSKII